MPHPEPLLATFLPVLAAWLLTYAIHSTVLLGAVWLLSRSGRLATVLEDTLWKVALVGALVTATWQVAGITGGPVGGSMDIARLTTMSAGSGASSSRTSGGWSPPTSGTRADETAASPTWRWRTAGTATPPAWRWRTAGDGVIVVHEASPAPGASPLRASAASGLAPGSETAHGTVVPTGGNGAITKATAVWRDATAWLKTASWLPALVVLWLAGAVLGLARLGWARLRLGWLLRGRRPLAGGPLVHMAERLRRTAGLRGPVRLTLSARLAGPAALGRDEICVPERALTDLSPEEQESALAHEMGHLARRDPWWLVFGAVMESLFFFQPLNRVARGRLRDTAEFLCDDWAVHHTGRGMALARCLAEVAGWIQTERPAPVSGMAQKDSPLVRRIERLLHEQPSHGPRTGWRVATAVALVLAVAVTAPGITAGPANSWDDLHRSAPRPTLAMAPGFPAPVRAVFLEEMPAASTRRHVILEDTAPVPAPVLERRVYPGKLVEPPVDVACPGHEPGEHRAEAHRSRLPNPREHVTQARSAKAAEIDPVVIVLDRLGELDLQGIDLQVDKLEATLGLDPGEFGVTLDLRLETLEMQQQALERQIEVLHEQHGLQEMLEGMKRIQIELFHDTDGDGGLTIDLNEVRHHILEWQSRGERMERDLQEVQRTLEQDVQRALEEDARREYQRVRDQEEAQRRLREAVKLNARPDPNA